MLPAEIPPDPSCSSKSLAAKTDEKLSEKLVFIEEIPTPNFCIRDYVFASRSKGIKASWPFAPETLQLYAKNGINDLLPPFEPPDLVRAQCPLITCSIIEQRSGRADVLKARDSDCSNGQPASIGKGSCWSPEDLVLDCLDKDKIDQGTSLDRKPLPSSSDSEDIEPRHKTKRSSEALENKCKLAARVSAIANTNRTEDVVSNSSTVSDPMVSKVCPVCKTFSSTSNTTLNAHIDQCLSTESNTNTVLNKFPKHKVKPTKKRLMVDIYTTAPSCTLEDLDRRNGTNWAVELALLVAPNAAATDTKKPKLSQNEPTKEGGEGAVYIDSNGIKLRILSKFNGTSLQENDLKLHKHTEEVNPDTSILIRKRKNISPKYSKNFKLKARVKPPSSFMLLKTKIPATSGGDYGEEDHQHTVEGESQLLVATNHVKRNISSNLRQLNSKYSDAPKKQTNKVSHVEMERTVLGDNGRFNPHNMHSIQNHKKKFTGPSGDLASSPETKRVDSLNAAAVNILNSKKTPLSNATCSSESTFSSNGLRLRFTRPSRKFPSSNSYSKDSMGMNDGSSDMVAKLKEPHNLKSKGLVKKSNFNFEANEGEAITETLTILKRIRRHRSNLRTAKRGIEVLPHTVGDVPGTFKDLSLENDKPFGSCQSSLSDDINQEPRSSSNGIQTSEGKDDYNRVQIGGCANLNERPPEGTKLNEHDETDIEYCPKLSSVKFVRGNANGNTENKQTNANTELDPSPCIEEPKYTLSGREQQLNRLEDLEILHGDIYSNEIGNHASPKEDQCEHDEVKESSLDIHDDCHLDIMSGQDSGCCLTSHDDLGLDLLNKSSSIASVRQTENCDTNLRGEKELSGSPVSTTSTVVPLSPRKTNSKDSEGDVLSRTTILEGKLGLLAPPTKISKEETERGFYGRNGENWNLPANDQIVNDKPCCCSCRESLSRDSQLLRQNATAKTVPAKQVPSLFTGPRISSSFSAYQSRRSNGVANTSLGPSSPIASTSNRQDAPVHYAASSHNSPIASSQSQNPSTSNPVLRLMGKNLMVVNKEELAQTQAVTLEQPPNLNTSSLAFASTNNHFRQELLPYHHQILSGSPASSSQAISDHQMPMQFPIITVGGFAGSSYNSSWIKPDYQSPHKGQYKRANSFPASYSTNEVILIDDNPEHETELRGSLVTPTNSLPFSSSSLHHLPQRPFACFPSQSFSREVPGAITPMFQNVYLNPRISASFANSGNIQEAQVTYVPNPLVFQSPMTGQIGSSIYYPQTLH